MIISFAWTTEVFLKGEKTVTRRYWKDKTAKRLIATNIMQAYDRLPWHGGKQIGEIILTKTPYQQKTGEMTDEDFKKEGLKWMWEHGILIQGKSAKDFFDEWKGKDDLVWVVEFEKI